LSRLPHNHDEDDEVEENPTWWLDIHFVRDCTWHMRGVNSKTKIADLVALSECEGCLIRNEGA
jgi:hypothetical protein